MLCQLIEEKTEAIASMADQKGHRDMELMIDPGAASSFVGREARAVEDLPVNPVPSGEAGKTWRNASGGKVFSTRNGESPV